MDGSCGKKDIKESQQLNGSTNSKRRYRNINKYREFYNPNRTIGTRNKRGERMKTKEFKKAIKDISIENNIDLKVTEDIYDFCIESETRILATVNKSIYCFIDTKYQGFLDMEKNQDKLYLKRFANLQIHHQKKDTMKRDII